MYSQIVGSTAVRKSSMVNAIISEFSNKLPLVNDPVDFVNYNYFLQRLEEFELARSIDY